MMMVIPNIIQNCTEYGGVRIPSMVLRGTLCGGDWDKTIDFSRLISTIDVVRKGWHVFLLRPEYN